MPVNISMSCILLFAISSPNVSHFAINIFRFSFRRITHDQNNYSYYIPLALSVVDFWYNWDFWKLENIAWHLGFRKGKNISKSLHHLEMSVLGMMGKVGMVMMVIVVGMMGVMGIVGI